MRQQKETISTLEPNTGCDKFSFSKFDALSLSPEQQVHSIKYQVGGIGKHNMMTVLEWLHCGYLYSGAQTGSDCNTGLSECVFPYFGTANLQRGGCQTYGPFWGP